MSAVDRERRVLDLIAPRLAAEGYAVFKHPSRTILPAFMQGYLPDAIALGAPKNLAIEIVQDEHRSTRKREDLASRFDGNPDWELRVFYLSSLADDFSMARPSAESVELAIQNARTLLDGGQTEAALLLAWAAFEAFGRMLLPEQLSHAQQPSQLLERLAGDGIVTSDEADRLRVIAKARNAIAHGDLDLDVDTASVRDLIAILHTSLREGASLPQVAAEP